jgi:small-conductance mechanosensitive channel
MILKKPSLFLLLALAFQAVLLASPQEKDDTRLVLNSGATITIQPLKLSKISTKIEEVSISLNKLIKKLNDDSELEKTDSIIAKKEVLIREEEKTINEKIEVFSTREIEDLEIRWNLFNKELKSNQAKLNKKTKELQNDKDFLYISLKTWELTIKSLKEQKGPQETIDRISGEIAHVNEYLKKINKRLNQISKVQNKITDLILITEKNLNLLQTQHLNWQSEFFSKDSPAIWAKQDTATIAKSAGGKIISFNIKENSQTVSNYFKDKTEMLYFQLLILLLLTFVFFQYHNKIKDTEISPDDTRMINVQFFLKYYFISAWMVSAMISIWMYADRPRAVNELIVFLLLIPSIFLYEKLLTKKLKIYIIPVIIIFLLDKAQLFIDLNDSFFRILLLLKSLVTIWILYILASPRKPIQRELHGKWWVFIFRVSFIFLTISLISFLANLFGYVNLSILLSRMVTYGILIGILLSLEIGILISLLIMLSQSKFMKNSNLVKNHQQLIEKRISFFLQFYALFLWLRSLLTSLGARSVFSNWFSSIMDSSLSIGTVTISFGGFINFFLVIISASLLAKIIRLVLEEEVFPRIELPRGVPGAISMVVRYFILGWGVYVALESAGIDLSSFGLLAGALGVGIGFGLQNIVANFISGLILTFERPIQTGDTIEVGTLMGDVKNIGVRASTIQTFDGSEVIVPNSNLITHEVINWTLSDRKRRRDIEVSTAYGTNPRKVLEIIKKIASDHPSVMKVPGVWATFEGFGESSLNFKVRFWVSFDIGLTVKSEVAMSIYDAFEEAGIRIPFPQQDLHIKSFDPTVQKTIFPGAKKKNKDDTDLKD